MSESNAAGLLVLHGNRLELLAEAVFSWLAAHPLAPLAQETFIVQSNGMAEWLKMAQAGAHGVCAATSVELPARFIWRAYRAVLGRSAVPPALALDKLPLTWRLMSQLPALALQPEFAPVAAFLGSGDASRRLQLAQRLADLFDQYQVYRSDWLHDWSRGQDRLQSGLPGSAGTSVPVPSEQLWQPALWRALQQALSSTDRAATRAELHRRFLAALRTPAPGQGARMAAAAALPRRIVLFGVTNIPHQTMEAIAALSAHVQVLMAVPNPCRYHWGDIIAGRELLQAKHHRHALRDGRDLSAVPLQDMHAHGHPLLAAWGRQARDFIRQLDALDDVQTARQRITVPQVDLFDEAPGHSLLTQVQAAIRDLVPLAEHAPTPVPLTDRSIVFHAAHSAQREVEILHDQLLELLARPPQGRRLDPRDIVVMVPDIDTFAPAIRAVFGQHGRGDARAIPWGIADQRNREHQPLLVALEWLLRAQQQRFGASEIRDLLDLPALARRFGIRADDVPILVAWIDGASVRWGLHEAQRASLGLAAAGDQNSWAFGLRRMVLGYATGEMPGAPGFAGIEPFGEVAGLSAGLAGSLADLLHVLTTWWRDAAVAQSPQAWAERLRQLQSDLFDAVDDTDRSVLATLDDALLSWLLACESAGFNEPVDLAVAREAWLAGVDQPGAAQRFKAGGVTFCTLLPMRAIPFDVVCLLGMNEGDYPRRSPAADFDLMALPGQARPGDRSRREDDRQLMLDALLSARRVLYISWTGFSQRDNQPQPPSVLVSQLQDYLDQGWGPSTVFGRSTAHALQPFSRRYFEVPPQAPDNTERLFTYAAEWRVAHAAERGDEVPQTGGRAAESGPARATPGEDLPASPPITLDQLAAFLRNPVRAFFRHRLQVSFTELNDAASDEEAFGSQGLGRWSWMNDALQACCRQLDGLAPAPTQEQIQQVLQQEVGRLQRAGRLPIAGPGQRAALELMDSLQPMLLAWVEALQAAERPLDTLSLRWAHPQDPGLVLDDGLPGLRQDSPEELPLWIELQPGKITVESKKKDGPNLRADKLLAAWLRCLASAACACPTGGLVIAEGAMVRVAPPAMSAAQDVLANLMRAYRDGVFGLQPLTTAVRTGLAILGDRAAAQEAFDGVFGSPGSGEGREACLARLFPDLSSLLAQPDFEPTSRLLYAPFAEWLAQHAQLERLGADAEKPEAQDE